MLNYFILMRPHHYVKNLFIFVPLFFAGQIFDLSLLLDTLIVAILFSVISSSIYIFNDDLYDHGSWHRSWESAGQRISIGFCSTPKI